MIIIYIFGLGASSGIHYIARIHRCKRLWCSIMDALTWGGGLVVRSVAEESVGSGGISFGEDGIGEEAF